jgi:signal transduction histidine kinase
MKSSFFEKFIGSVPVENMTQRVQWLIFLRWIAGVGVIISTLAGKAFFHIHNITIPLLLGVSVLLYNAAFHLITQYIFNQKTAAQTNGGIRRRLIAINIQILLDLLVLTTLIYFTGTYINPFFLFFVFHMVISSILLSRINAYGWAAFTIITVSAVFCLEHFNYIPHRHFFPFYPREIVGNGWYVLLFLLVFGITMIVTVYFATTMMRSIRKQQMDLTDLKNDLKEQRDQLEIKNKELEELDQSKTSFLHRVEHELKAPIDALRSLLSVVSRGGIKLDEEKRKDFLSRAERRVVVMKELVTDLLSLSRINERRFQLDIETVEMNKIIDDVIGDLTTFARKKGIKIRQDFALPIPKITGDSTALAEVSYNLIHNAVKYSFGGEVEVSLFPVNGRLMFRVRDSGIGISDEDIKKIFNEFYRTANAKAFEEGTGLGLSLVKRLIEQHGGTIDVDSRLNEGTTFTVSLPV